MQRPLAFGPVPCHVKEESHPLATEPGEVVMMTRDDAGGHRTKAVSQGPCKVPCEAGIKSESISDPVLLACYP